MNLLVSFLLVAFLGLGSAFNATKINPDTVKSLDIPKYLGLWYQMTGNKFVFSTFEKDAFCATARYGDNGDGTISVHNYATISAPNGSPYSIDGYAYQSNLPDYPGQLKVKFDSSDAVSFASPYWVLQLGPVNANNQYDWAIVSDNLSTALFVLARDVNVFNAKYKTEVYKTLTDLGFTGYSAPIDMYHNSDCVYESTKRRQEISKFEASK